MKHELGGQIIKKITGLRAKPYSYLKDNNDEDKKAKESVSSKEILNLEIIKSV